MLVNNYPDQYVGVVCSASSPFDLSIYTTRPLTGMYDQGGNIYVRNTSCTPQTATVTLTFSPKWHFTGISSPAASSSTGNNITWNLPAMDANTTLVPYHISYLLLYNPATGFLTPGDTVQTHAEVDPIVGDANMADNTEFVVDTVTSSFDPNEMWVSPAGNILSGTRLRYTVNFENTGNAPARNIYVLDTLSENLDYRSLNMISASAELNTTLIKTGGYHIMKFDFPNINLLDSSHHGLCDGEFIYTINTKTGLPDGTIIPNRAGIYFDGNTVVMTNEVKNVIGTPLSVAKVSDGPAISIFPNPAVQSLAISLQGAGYATFTISDAIGQLRLAGNLTGATTHTDLTALRAGLYYITFRGEAGVKTLQFVKM